ncbi:restriction endonuclease subunit S domain-containing protein [Mycoplasmopsis citelli]|uniref:hypothetical protein n=1 Tax=Mycoplasmopsis citelli TaxID=171281 RepID=UPI00101C2734|nr:hypothetical protein [Mycoplasmopsis citelli]
MKNIFIKIKKAISSLAIGIGVTAGAALVSVGVLLSLHNYYQVPREQSYFFTELQNQVIKTQNTLKNLSAEDLKNPEIEKLSKEVDYANQSLSSEDSSIATMLQQRNKLRHCLMLLKTRTKKRILLKNTIL